MPRPGDPVDPLFLTFQSALAGRYSIHRELGRGGMGIVYLAREVHLDRSVAIKLLPPERAAQAPLRQRFLREARLAAGLSHPNIIPIHSVEDAGDFVFYVMAFVDGETLAQRVHQRGPLPPSEASRILREVAWALASAHAQGLVHRDVKPDNILIERATGRVLVTDFGIAAAAGDAGDGISGTPEFMSPEQALGGQVDARSDLYGLGATAFFALSGRLPFEGGSSTEVLARQVTELPPQFASLGVTVPRKLALLIDRCLAKPPDHRPASAQALAEQLGLALEQRREVPAALRAFVKRYGRLDGGGTLIGLFVLLSASIIIAALFGTTAGFMKLLFGVTVAPFAYLVVVARRLSLLGYTHQDLEPAFKGEIEQAREELSVGHSSGPSAFERLLPPVMKMGAGALGAATIGLFLGPSFPFFQAAASMFGLAAGTTLISSVAWLALQQRRRDVDTEFWAKMWMGRIGKFAFSVARKLIGKRAIAPAMTHRATELSLGMAAEQLFENLPKESRQALGDLPALLRRLESDAQSLRARYEEFQEVLGDGGDDAASAEYADLRAARDATRTKLGDAVGALETIRLNLLRLHAGSVTVAGLTTHLGLAAAVSDDVERLIAAQEEVERIVKYPLRPSPTPV